MRLALLASTAVLALAATSASAEEGMWTYDNFPIARANQALGTNIDQAFLDRVRLSSVKFGGCSAGVVSGQGLVMTNNHCVATCVANLSTPQVNYAETGFTPKSREEELKCPGATAEILTDISDVTERMHKAGEGLEGQAFTQARDAEAGRIETEACGNDAKVRCQVVSLYRGGQFKLYTYRKYSDVRLAWAPEDRAATFGGDLDNFSFPRFAIDAAFIRLYEDGKLVETPTHFVWNPNKPTEGEAVFVSGNPGSTQRLLTMDQLTTISDVVLPLDQLIASELRGRLIRYAEEGEEQAFIAMDPIVGLENTYKRGRGRMAALIDPAFMATKAEQETDFRARAASSGVDPWTSLSTVQPIARELYPSMALLEGGTGLGTTSVAGGSQLFAWARTLVRGAQERAKPSDQRLPEFADSRLSGVESRLFAERPTYPELEQIRLEWWLSKTREWLTVDNPQVATLLGKESPEALSARVVAGTTLADPAVRRALWTGGLAAVQASTDPMIQYALAIDADARAVRDAWETRVQAPTDRASEQLAAARFAAYGDAVYPDATGTLRLTYGQVEGSDVPGQRFSAFTTFAGLWDRATGAEPFAVAPKLLAAKDRIDPTAVMDMAVSTDTIGGSSGSPAINAKGEIVGANFDSTVLTQRNAYGYDRAVNRSVIVTTQAVTVALRDVYGMDHLVEELGVPPVSEIAFRAATPDDVAALHPLIERAYRGETAKAGWTHEADLLFDTRTSAQELSALIVDPDRVILLAHQDGALIGCVQVARVGDDRTYLGMLTVEPSLQASGLGRRLLAAAEAEAVSRFGARRMEMTVIHRRTELIAWYERRGYAATGETRPFPVAPPRPELDFVVLEKGL